MTYKIICVCEMIETVEAINKVGHAEPPIHVRAFGCVC